MKHTILLMSLAVSASLAGAWAAEEFHVPRARLPLMGAAPAIDGEIREEEWAGALRVERFCGVRDPMLTGGEAAFWLGCDGSTLFLAVSSETPSGGQILQRVEPAPEEGDARVWLDDSIEIVLDPLRAAPEERRRLYHAIINAKGAIYDQRHTVKGGGEAWRGRWKTASKIAGDRWSFEASLPLADLGVTPADLKSPFGMRVCRNWMRAEGPAQSEWSAVGGAFLSVETMPEITWDAGAPVVQTLQLRDAGADTPHIRVAIRNPGEKPLPVQATLRIRPKNSAPAELGKPLTVAPGATEIVELACGLARGDQAYTLLQVTSPDGAQVYYLRDFQWQMQRPEPFFTLAKEDAKRVGLDFAYHPSHHVIKARVDVSGLQDKEKVTGVRLELRPKAGGKVLARTAMPALREYRTQAEWKVPALGAGEYQLVALLDGVKTEPVVGAFVRRVFPWEGNRIGQSDILIPPFTPIKVAGNKVATILRTHTLGPAGLWSQVESQGTPLLKGPMRLEVTAGGKSVPATGPALTFTEKKETHAVAGGPWAPRPLSGRGAPPGGLVGVMKWARQIDPAKAPVDAVTLTIPLDNALCPLMHACTDGIRFNYAGAVPAGEGPVWESTKAARNSLLGNYVPYLWVGEEERGLCVFGENDRGWVTDPKVPCQELVRRGDTLDLVLRLVAKPAVLDTPRSITLGFQATPVKPMPPDWRTWIFGAWRAQGIPGVSRYIAFLGSCWYWGTETPCLDWYPRNADMTYLRKLADIRRTGEVDTAYFEEWLKGFEQEYAAAKTPEARKQVETAFRNHTFAAVRTMKSKPPYVNFYFNGRGVRFDTPEGQTFLDEWYREAFAKRDWSHGDGVAYDLDPVASFRDYALHYIKEMAGIVLDSVYWDDLYLQSNFDTVGTEAYETASGHIQPSMGLWNMREFVKRTGRMYVEMGRPVQNIVHMTNAAIVPVLSFAQMNYAWEDKAGAADFQDRFTREYTRAESIGLQQGNVPIALWLVNGGDKAKMDWVERTGTGVMLVHEMKTTGGGDTFWGTYGKMVEFGYGKPEVRVSQYWKKGHPAKVEGSDAVTLVLSKPGSALVLVCDYGEGGNLSLVLDRKALALPARFGARNLETGEALEVTGEGKVRFPLKKHDFALVLAEGL